MSDVRLLDLLGLPEPHPDYVAAIWPTAPQMVEAVFVMGLLPEPEDRVFRPAAVG